MTTLYIIQGFIGSGKTTFSKLFAVQTQAIRLNADEWVEKNCLPKEAEDNWEACYAKAVTNLWQQAEELQLQKKDVILDFGFWTVESRNFARRKAKAWDADVVHIYLAAPDHVLKERLKSRAGKIALGNLENFHSLKKSFEPPAESEKALIVNTDKAYDLNALFPG